MSYVNGQKKMASTENREWSVLGIESAVREAFGRLGYLGCSRRAAGSSERIFERTGCIRVVANWQWKILLLWLSSSRLQLAAKIKQFSRGSH